MTRMRTLLNGERGTALLETALTLCAVAPVVALVPCLLLPAPGRRVAAEPVTT